MAVRIEPGTLFSMVTNWEPPETPHCSNCVHAKVTGSPEQPGVYCAKAHGGTMDLWTLIRTKRPRQFIPAVRCPDFESMS